MAAAQGLYAEKVTDTDANSTTWVDICSIAAASFTANKTYLIVANVLATCSGGSTEVRLRLVHGTTPTVFTDASLAFETANTQQQGVCAGWMTTFAQGGTTELVKLQVSNSSTDTSRAQLGQIFALNLDDVGTQNTDWFYTEDTVDYTTTGSKVSKASVTFTPNGTDDWLIIGAFAQTVGSTTANYLADLNDSVAGVLTSLDIEGEDTTNEIRGHMLMRVVTPTNASHTFSLRFSHETTAGVIQSNRIFALNLNKFRNHTSAFTAADDTPAATPSWTTTQTISPTPDVTGDWFIWGHFVDDHGALTDSLGSRLQVNAAGGGLASQPAYGDDMPANDNSWDATDEIPIHLFTLLSLTSGAARDINLGVQRISGTTVTVQNRQLVAFSMELPAGGGATQYNQSVDGTLTTAGGIVKQDQTIKAGTLTSAGAIVKQDQTVKAGTLTMAGALTKQDQKVAAGTLTTAGALVKQTTHILAGTLTTAGALANQTAKVVAGTLSTAGTLAKQTATAMAGTLTSSGLLSGTKVTLLSLTATLTTAGALVNQTARNLAGTLSPSGTLTKAVATTLAATLATAGALTKRTATWMTGALSSAGAFLSQYIAGSGPPVVALPYQGEAVVYDQLGAMGTIVGGLPFAVANVYDQSSATGAISGGAVLPVATTYGQASAKGSIAGGTPLPTDTTEDATGATGTITGGVVLPSETTL